MDEAGRPSFQLLAERMHVREPARAARLAVALPVSYLAFDVLRAAGRDLLATPYTTRRDLLEGLSLGASGRHPAVLRRRPGDRDRQPRQRARRRRRQADRLALPARAPLAGLGEGQTGGELPSSSSAAGGPASGPSAPCWSASPARRRAHLPRPGRRRASPAPPSGRCSTRCGPLASPQSPFARHGAARGRPRRRLGASPELVVEVKFGHRTRDGRLRFPRFLRIRPDLTRRGRVRMPMS